jgi:hypothetical protein
MKEINPDIKQSENKDYTILSPEAELINTQRKRVKLVSLDLIRNSPEWMAVADMLMQNIGAKETFAVLSRLLSIETSDDPVNKAAELLTILKNHSELTYKHSIRLHDLVRKSGISADRFGIFYDIDFDRLAFGMLLHDIGKIGTPLSILASEKKKLSEEEYEVIHDHPVLSGRILEALQFDHRTIDIGRFHHVRQKTDHGTLAVTGYPAEEYKTYAEEMNLQNKPISKELILAGFFDVFEALTGERKTKRIFSDSSPAPTAEARPYTSREALDIMEQKPELFADESYKAIFRDFKKMILAAESELELDKAA